MSAVPPPNKARRELLQLPCLGYLDGEDAHLPGSRHVAVAVVHKDGGVCGGSTLLQSDLKGLHQRLCFSIWLDAEGCAALPRSSLPNAKGYAQGIAAQAESQWARHTGWQTFLTSRLQVS